MEWICLAHRTRVLGASTQEGTCGGARRGWGWERSRGSCCTVLREACPTVNSSERGSFRFFLCSDFTWVWVGVREGL